MEIFSVANVSTHSRTEAAADDVYLNGYGNFVSTHSRTEAAAKTFNRAKC